MMFHHPFSHFFIIVIFLHLKADFTSQRSALVFVFSFSFSLLSTPPREGVIPGRLCRNCDRNSAGHSKAPIWRDAQTPLSQSLHSLCLVASRHSLRKDIAQLERPNLRAVSTTRRMTSVFCFSLFFSLAPSLHVLCLLFPCGHEFLELLYHSLLIRHR
jgi:hypothetical protein